MRVETPAVLTTPRIIFGGVTVSLVGLLLIWSGSAGASLRVARLSGITPVYLANAPDPTVLVVGTTLYVYTTGNGEENIPLLESTDGVHWRSMGDALPVLPAWVQSGYTWSPSVVRLARGGYEMFFDAYDARERVQCIGRATSSAPDGPFVDTSSTPFLCQQALGGSIDASVYQQKSGDILIWKSDGTVAIWSQRLGAKDTTLIGEPTLLLSPDESWEKGVIEGPVMARIDGELTLWFSAGRWSDSSYEIGTATCSSPLAPCDAASAAPELASGPLLTGPGGPSLFRSHGRLILAFAAWIGGDRGLYLADVSISDAQGTR